MTENRQTIIVTITVIDFNRRFVSETKQIQKPLPETSFICHALMVGCLYSQTNTRNMQKSLKILFVVNPIAGGKEKKDWETAIREFFKESPCVIEFFIQTGENDKASIKRHIDLLQPEVIAAVGGDGTVKMVAELVKETDMRLGIIPAGSANGLACRFARRREASWLTREFRAYPS